MREIICIACPNGCKINIDVDNLLVYNNKCQKGKEFAINEVTNPKRNITTSVRSTVKGYPVISVRTDKEISKAKIFDLIKELKKIVVKDTLPIGTTIIENVLGTGVNIITTTEMKK